MSNGDPVKLAFNKTIDEKEKKLTGQMVEQRIANEQEKPSS